MIRKAKVSDAEVIHNIISVFAKESVMLPRSLNSIYEYIRDFWVAEDEEGTVLGCAALHVIGWEGLAEIRSLSVEARAQKYGFGKKLIDACMEEAMKMGVKRVFALTFVPEFFEKYEFDVVDKDTLPHKIWSDCIDCPFFPNCKEIAVAKDVESHIMA